MTRSNVFYGLTPEQREAVYAALPQETGDGRFTNYSIYRMPTTGTPKYIEVRSCHGMRRQVWPPPTDPADCQDGLRWWERSPPKK